MSLLLLFRPRRVSAVTGADDVDLGYIKRSDKPHQYVSDHDWERFKKLRRELAPIIASDVVPEELESSPSKIAVRTQKTTSKASANLEDLQILALQIAELKNELESFLENKKQEGIAAKLNEIEMLLARRQEVAKRLLEEEEEFAILLLMSDD